MEEYEYNFKVKDIKPYIDYCEKNNYKKVGVFKQERIVYQNKYNNNLLARITTNDNEKSILDFKNVTENDELLKISNESLPITITEENNKEINSLIETLCFIKTATINRTRYIYTKDEVTFEIDEYINPEAKVVAIEGNREKVDAIYKEIELLDLH